MMIAPSLNYVVQIVICRQITSFSREKETISEKCLRSSPLSLTTYLRANRVCVRVYVCCIAFGRVELVAVGFILHVRV